MSERETFPLCEEMHVHADALRRVQEVLPREGELARLADLYRVFADPTRLSILLALEAGELCVCDIAGLLGVTKSAVSHQLRTLREARLIATRRVGRNVLCSLADSHVGSILDIAREHLAE